VGRNAQEKVGKGKKGLAGEGVFQPTSQRAFYMGEAEGRNFPSSV